MIQPNEVLIAGSPSIQYLLQHTRQSAGGMLVAGTGGSPPQLNTSRLTSNLNMGPHSHGSPPQGLMGPPGFSPAGGGGRNLLSQSQPQRVHSPIQSHPAGRPNSAPSVQPGLLND